MARQEKKLGPKKSDLAVRKTPKQLLKWIGNKQRFAPQIVSVFPKDYNCYIEPFVGSGAVLAAIAPQKAIAGDLLKPLIEMWEIVQKKPEALKKYYELLWMKSVVDKKNTYRSVLDSYNSNPNPFDFLYISRSCYGGVIRFTKTGRMSTPVGPHTPIPPEEFAARIDEWQKVLKNTIFLHSPFEKTMAMARENDIVYCDPPYIDSQSILYGAQSFDFNKLLDAIAQCKSRGAKVALSIDGHKKSGKKIINLEIPIGLFERELLIDGGSSMLRRFQKKGSSMNGEDVRDRLLLTW